MNWQTIDFQGIAGLESSVVQHFQRYLEEKESRLARLIALSIPLTSEAGPSPNLPEPMVRAKLSEGVEAFTRRAHQEASSFESPSSKSAWRKTAHSINVAIWEYVEILEESAVELFQQLDQVGFEQWRPKLIQVVESIRDLLTHSMEDMKWALKRLESQLQDYRLLSEKQRPLILRLVSVLFSKNAILDPLIARNLERSQKFLNFSYQNFIHRYNEFEGLQKDVDKMMEKFDGYTLLKSIERDEQQKFMQLYRLLKMWEQNARAKVISDLEFIRGIHRVVDPEKACQVFKDYYQAIRNHIFAASRSLKEGNIETIPVDREQLLRTLGHYRIELHTLGATIVKYREFLLNSDPDPYVRTRGAYPEWIIGLEPAQTKPLVYQEYDIETLDHILLKFMDSMRSVDDHTAQTDELCQEIWEILHDMGQPLASRSMMAMRSGHFVDKLHRLNEMTSSDATIIDKVTLQLSRALRADWKYNTLNEIPQFHELYAIHQGLLGPNPDRTHRTRLAEFKLLTERLYGHIKEKNLLKYRHEVELDINDIKQSLQDLFAHVQRSASHSTPELIEDISRQLLEYRYLFSHFFHQLRGVESDEKLLRTQFLFVYHYFESIENKLVEMHDAAGKPEGG